MENTEREELTAEAVDLSDIEVLEEAFTPEVGLGRSQKKDRVIKV